MSPSLFKIFILVILLAFALLVSAQEEANDETTDPDPLDLSDPDNQILSSTLSSTSESESASPEITESTEGSGTHEILIIISWSSIAIAIIIVGIVLLSGIILYCFFCLGENRQTKDGNRRGEYSRVIRNSSIGSLMKTQSLSGGRQSRSKSKSKSSSATSSGIFAPSQNGPSSVIFNSADSAPVRINPPASTIGSVWSNTGFLATVPNSTSPTKTTSSRVKSSKSVAPGSNVSSFASSSTGFNVNVASSSSSGSNSAEPNKKK